MMTIKLKYKILMIWILGGLMSIFSQTYANQSMQNTSTPVPVGVVSIPLGENLTEKQFKAISRPFVKLGQKPQVYENDFCVGVIEDEEQAKGYGVLNFRQYKAQYAIDLVIFDGAMKKQNVMVGNKRFNLLSSIADVKKMDAELSENDDNGVVQDRVTSKKYPYTRSLTLRNKNQDDLNIFYFDGVKLIAIQYVVQC